METLSLLTIAWGLLTMCNGYYWLYYRFKKSEEQITVLQKSPNTTVIINDIELGSIRFYLKGEQILPIRVDGLLLKDSCTHIQQMENTEDVLNRIVVERHPAFEKLKYVKIYAFYQNRICIDSIQADSSLTINSAKATLIEKHRSINLQLKLSETFETEEEAKQILLSKLDNQFDNELQLLQDKYNKQLDNLI